MGESPKAIMNFKGTIDSLIGGKKVRRIDWPDDGTYIAINNEALMIYKPEIKKFAPLIVSMGDLLGDDWIAVN